MRKRENEIYRRPIWSYTGLLTGLALALGTLARADSLDFKFPILLCVYQVSSVTEQGGYPEAVAKQSGIHAFPVRHIRTRIIPANDGSGRTLRVMTGEVSQQVRIADSPYRFEFKARITQGLGDGTTDQLRLKSFLEKRDPETGDYHWAGQRESLVTAAEASDGTIWKDVYARADNSLPVMDAYKNPAGGFDISMVNAGISDHKLNLGAVFQAGPVCSLMDLETVRTRNFPHEEFAEIFKRADQRRAALARVQAQAVARRQARERAIELAERRADERAEAEAEAAQMNPTPPIQAQQAPGFEQPQSGQQYPQPSSQEVAMQNAPSIPAQSQDSAEGPPTAPAAQPGVAQVRSF